MEWNDDTANERGGDRNVPWCKMKQAWQYIHKRIILAFQAFRVIESHVSLYWISFSASKYDADASKSVQLSREEERERGGSKEE